MPKSKTTSMYSISTTFLRKHFTHDGEGVMTVNGKYVCNVAVHGDIMQIHYAVLQDDGSKFNVAVSIPLEVTPCNYGGGRRWFLCPHCGRRCGVLYMGYSVACRRCLNLVYPCQADRYKRGWCLYWKILEKIGGVHGKRPKGMHRETFYRLTEKADKLCGRQALPILKRLERRKEAT